ncbi:MAG: glycine--tRNA ligase subunit beta, partial [Novosphingobium sp.]
MPDFLLELRCEEIPARMQAGARADLLRLYREHMAAAGLPTHDVTVFSTPRRLALIAKDLPESSQSKSDERKGPRADAPAQAIEGFLRSTGLTRDQLVEVVDAKGVTTLFAKIEKPGRATAEVLAEAIPAIVRAFPWPKSMRWGAASLSSESLRWVRPLSGIVAILGDSLVECEVGGIRSGFATHGHRFHCPGEITIGGASDYAEKLRACHVLVDHEERQNLIRSGAAAAAAAAGLALIEDEGLVIENAGLTEWPVPLLGRFDEAFLDVPPEVIQLTARTNQKYFVCESPLPLAGGAGGGPTPNPPRKREGNLANAFVCTANIVASDGGAEIVAGNRKVLAARLSDARFFWEQDRKVPLAEQAKKLERITFHEKLGTVADKVERVAKLARWLVEEGIILPETGRGTAPAGRGGGVRASDPDSAGQHPQDHSLVPLHHPADGPPPRSGEDLADMAEQAARLCKADLVTEMVGEFPELQGLMGGYYARAEGLPDAIADAIRDHYKPVGQGDEVPTAPVTVAVSLADKLDTICSFFFESMPPTGTKDPFALRRAALSAINLMLSNGLRVSLRDAVANTAGRIAAMQLGRSTRERVEELIAAMEALHGPLSSDEREDIVNHYRQELQDRNLIRRLFEQQFDACVDQVQVFFADRLKVQQREAGVRHDLIDAVFALGGEDDLVRLLARVHALQAFVGTADGANLLAGYKRAANILKKEGVTPAQAGAQTAQIDAPQSGTPSSGLGP